ALLGLVGALAEVVVVEVRRRVSEVGLRLGSEVVVLPRQVEGVVVGARGSEHREPRQHREGPRASSRQPHRASCSAATSSGPRFSASRPETAASAPATVVMTGTPTDSAHLRIAFSSYSDARPSGVLITSWISPASMRSTALGLPSWTLNTSRHGTPLRRKNRAVPRVANSAYPSSTSFFAMKVMARLSSSRRLRNTAPS